MSDPVFANYEQYRDAYRKTGRATWQGMMAAATVMLRDLGSSQMTGIVDLEAQRMEVMQMLLATPEQREEYQRACNSLFEAQMECIGKLNNSKRDAPMVWMRMLDPQVTVEHGPAEKPVEIRLRHGAPVHVRAVRSTDPQAVEKFLHGLGPTSYVYRFPQNPGSRAQLADAIVFGASHPGQRNHAAVGCDAEENIVGLVDYHERATPCSEIDLFAAKDEGLTPPDFGLKTCEVNLVLADTLHGQGAGSQLLAHAMESARTDGYQQMIAVVDDTNKGMRAVLANAGFGRGLPMTSLPGYHRYVVDLRASARE